MPSSLSRDATSTPTPVLRAAPLPGSRERHGVDWLLVAAIAAIVGVYVRAFLFTPTEAMQGPAQKIMYVHVPSAIVGLYLAIPLLAVTSALYLWLKVDKLDWMAESAAEVGMVFMTAVLLTGPLWGKPIWGTWWDWDARLTSTLFLWFVLVSYLVLRGAIEEAEMRARFSAVLAVLAALLVPFIHLSVYLFRTLHPMPVVLKPGRPSMPDEMLVTFVLGFVAFALLFAALLRARFRLGVRRDALLAREELH